MSIIKIGTRKSPLAMWQANHVSALLKKSNPALDVQLIKITTTGDKLLDAPLSEFGGKGLFLKELEQALYDDRIDIAVHSMKDITVVLPDGLKIGAILKREDASDAMVSDNFSSFATMPIDSKVGTCSLRRQALLNYHFKQLTVENLRGNVSTRLKKLNRGEYDAIILATAGLVRLGLDNLIKMRLPIETFVPAVGQGAIGIQCREDDKRIESIINPLNDQETSTCILAEREVNFLLNGGCHIPLAVHATVLGCDLSINAFTGLPDGSETVKVSRVMKGMDPHRASEQVADELINNGADKIIERVYGSK